MRARQKRGVAKMEKKKGKTKKKGKKK